MNATIRQTPEGMLSFILDWMGSHLPSSVDRDYFDGFVERNHVQLLAIVRTHLFPQQVDLRTSRERALANLAAMEVVARYARGGRPTADELRTLGQYSGWGGIGLEAWQGRFPAGLHVDPQALIHEYYTPTVVAEAVGAAVRSLSPTLPVGQDGVVEALEPSAGIGRFIRSAPSDLRWTAVEFSAASAAILRLLRADVALHVGTFESWVAKNEAPRFGLVLSNPPYGHRGASFVDDPDRRTHDIKDAYVYFLLRTAGLLAPGGVGVYLIPRGFMDGKRPHFERLRGAVLRTHHLMTAFRLPSNDPSRGHDGNLFPGANVVVDLVFLRRRPGALGDVDAADHGIVAGNWFQEHPENILGQEVIEQDANGRKARFGGYEVHGAFHGLPAWTERPLCEACAVVSTKAPVAAAPTAGAVDLDEDEALASAHLLGERVEAWLQAVRDDVALAARLHGELLDGLRGWATVYGAPRKHPSLKTALAAHGQAAIRRFVEAFDGANVTSAIATPPAAPKPPYGREPTDIADWLYRQRGHLTVDDVHQEHRRLGGRRTAADVRTTLLGKGWCLDGDGWTDLHPERVYTTGHLWPKIDRARARADQDEVARRQLDLLRKALRPAALADIENIEPRQSWVPAAVISAWANHTMLDHYARRKVGVTWADGLLQLDGVAYEQLDNTERGRGGSDLSAELLAFIGWANHDATLFRPARRELPGGEKETLDEARLRVAEGWRQSFAEWLTRHPEQADVLVERYNRLFRGYVEPAILTRPLSAARWRNVRLHPYQVASAQRLIAQRKGLLALDVGLGKTFTALAVIAAAREEGWARRPVLLVPNSLVWKWKRDIAKVLPDYRAVVVGSELYRGRDGRVRSRTDSPAVRGQKWTAFRAGAFEVAIVAYSVFHRTRMRPGPVEAYTRELEAVQRTVTLRRRNIQRSQQGKKPRELSERDQAILREGAKAWVAEKMQLPPGQQYDEGVWWDDIGVDLLVVDEAQNFKNLFLPEEREGGVPDYMGNPGEGSDRAWNLDFRAASVRARTGGAGVILLSATPAKNSPLELYNALQLIDPAVMRRSGITDPEHFIDRFCGFTQRQQEDVTGKVKTRLACTSFVNLHELRDLLYSVAEYKTADEVGLKIPEPVTRLIDVPLDERASENIAEAISEIEQLDERRSLAAKTGNVDGVAALTMKIMGVKQRIAMFGIHPDLPGIGEGYPNPDKNPAVAATDPHSGKIDAVVAHILPQMNCGHIVFCDYLAAHVWLKRALVEAGIPEARIAVLNAPMVPDTESRQKIAMAFNGVGEPGDPEYEPAQYDVVIANAVAYEGVDLQRRTCAIHHIDLPWEPATLRQRNGRGVRQGNLAGQVQLYYYLAVGTGDRERLDKIRGKAGWMNALSDKNARETANPAAQLDDDGWEEFQVRHSRDPERARARLEQRRFEAREAARLRRELLTRRMLRAANDLFRKAEASQEPAEAATMLAEAERRLDIVLAADVETFPWVTHAPVVRARPVFVPEGGPILYEGLTTHRFRIGKQGRSARGEPVIGVLPTGLVTWEGMSLAAPSTTGVPSDVIVQEPPEPAQRDEIARRIMRLGWREVQIARADDAWIAWWWPAIRAVLSSAVDGYAFEVPVRRDGGTQLVSPSHLRPDDYVYPPDQDGFLRFCAEAPTNPGLTFSVADRAALGWWLRPLPRNAFSRVRGGEGADAPSR